MGTSGTSIKFYRFIVEDLGCYRFIAEIFEII